MTADGCATPSSQVGSYGISRAVNSGDPKMPSESSVSAHAQRRTGFSAAVALSAAAAFVGLPLVAAMPASAIPLATQTVTFEVSGAQGAGVGGAGGVVTASRTLAVGAVMTLSVGGSAGFNGGGAAGLPDGTGAGGGASDVRIGGTGLDDRVLVAGGGGGVGGASMPGSAQPGGAGGGAGAGAVGGTWTFDGDQGGAGGGGASGATGGTGGAAALAGACGPEAAGADGSLGTGGTGGSGAGTASGGGGGGGGYFGGGGGASSGETCAFPGGGGGGGGGYVDASFTGLGSSAGAHSGDGSIRISLDGGASWVSYGYLGAQDTYTVPTRPNPISLTPTRVAADGGDHFLISGDHLDGVDGVTVGGIAATFVVTSDGFGTLDVVTPSSIALGPNTVHVHSAADGPATKDLTITGFRVPHVNTVTPAVADVAGGTTVHLSGTELLGSTLTIDAVPVSVTVTDTDMSFVAPAHPAGDVALVIDNADAGTNATLTYDSPPTISSFDPAGGPLTGGQTLTIDGDHFVGTATVNLGSHLLTPSTVMPTQITVVVPSVSSAENDAVSVTTPLGTAIATGEYEYRAAPTGTFDQAYGPSSGGNTVIVSGTDLAGAVVAVDGQPLTPDSTTATTVTLTMPAHAAGDVPVVVATDGGTIPLTYHYWAAPTVTSVSASSGPVAGSSVTLVGTGFDAPGLVVMIGSTQLAATATATTLTFTVPAHPGGSTLVVVSTVGGSVSSSFRYVAAPDVPDRLDVGLVGGPVTVDGTDLDGAVVTVNGVATPITDASDTAFTVTVPPHAAGDGQIFVTTVGGGATTVLHYQGTPALTSATPSPVSDAFPTTTISGTDLVDPALVTIDGQAASIVSSTASSLTVMAPVLHLGRYAVSVVTTGGTARAAGLYAVTETASVTLSDDSVARAVQIKVSVRGFDPGSEVTLVLHSAPVAIGTLTAGPDGRGTVTVTIPGDATAGSHIIEAAGTDVAGATQRVFAALTVAAGPIITPDSSVSTGAAVLVDGSAPADGSSTLPYTGFDFGGAVGLGLLSFGGGVGLVVVGRVRRRSRRG